MTSQPKIGVLNFDTAGVFQLVHDLRAENVDADIDLPRLACVGKQSSGKSSVIESLTKLQVPRKENTCTRGAIEICTKNDRDVEWIADISLRMNYDDADGTTRTSPQTIHLQTLHEPNQMETALLEAQALVLNPKSFLDHKWPGGKNQAREEIQKRPIESWELKFTRNVVQVVLRGKEFHNLIVTDLPGLIQSTDTREDERYINMIYDLCEDYCKPANTVIVTCFCCNDDMENQAIRKLARDMDDSGARTVGVLTKPDLIQPSTEETWIQIFQNKKYPLTKGYFIVRNRTPEELAKGDSLADSTVELERKFFRESAIGKQFPVIAHERCGMDELRRALSSLLKQKIEEQLPDLHEQLTSKYDENCSALEQMGPSLTGELEVRRLLVSKCNQLAQKMQDACLIVRDQETSSPVDDAVWKKIEELYLLTYHKILGTKPLFCNGEEELPSLEEEGGFDQGKEASAGGTGRNPVTAGCHVQIEDIRKRIEECRGRNLKVSGSPPAYQVAMEMMKKTVQSWERFSLETLETVIELITHAVRVHADEVLREFPSLHRKMVDLLLTLLAEIAVRTHQQVAFFMEMETTNPFTVNAHYLDSQVTKATINLRKKMGKFSLNNLDEYHQRQLASLIAEAGGDVSLLWVADRTGRGENELVCAMAIAQSYFKVSHKRFADNLLMTVDHMMLRGFATRIQQHLLESLQVFEASTEDLMCLVREDDGKTRRRELIQNAVKRQREGLNKLDSFMSLNTSIRVRLRRPQGDTFAGLPDISGIFSSGRSLSLLQGSRLGAILGSENPAEKAAEDRRVALKQERRERQSGNDPKKMKMDEKTKKDKKQAKKDRKEGMVKEEVVAPVAVPKTSAKAAPGTPF